MPKCMLLTLHDPDMTRHKGTQGILTATQARIILLTATQAHNII